MMYWKQLFFGRASDRPSKMALMSHVRNQIVADYGRLRELVEAEARSINQPPPQFVFTSFHNRDVHFPHGYKEVADTFPQYIDGETEDRIRRIFEVSVDGTDVNGVGYKGYYP